MQQYLTIYRNLCRVVGENRKLTFLMFFSSAAYNLIVLLPPVATAGVIKVVMDNNFDGIWYYVGLYIVFYIAYFAFMRLNYYSYTKIAEFYHIGTQEKLFDHLAAHPDILQKLPRGRIMDTFADDIRWSVDALNSAVEALIRLIQLIIVFIIFINYDLFIAGVAVIIDLLYLYLLNKNAKEEARRYANARRAEDGAISAFSELAEGKSVSADFPPESSRGKMEKSFTPWRREYRKKRRAIYARYTSMPSIVYLGKIALYVLLAKFVIDGIMGIDLLVLLISYFELTITCMDKMQAHLLDLSNYGVRIDRIKKLLSTT